jgi:hypothetical protein
LVDSDEITSPGVLPQQEEQGGHVFGIERRFDVGEVDSRVLRVGAGSQVSPATLSIDFGNDGSRIEMTDSLDAAVKRNIGQFIRKGGYREYVEHERDVRSISGLRIER